MRYISFFVLLMLSTALAGQRQLPDLVPEARILYTELAQEELNHRLSSNGFPTPEAIFAEAGLYRINLSKKEFKTLNKMEDGLEIAVYSPHRAEQRKLPNDPGVSSMWSIDALRVEYAWDYSTAGVTENGDTIVIAIIDSGIDLDHEDLKGQIWVNRDEIPDNGVDDDNNGLVDDYNAYDFRKDVGYLDPSSGRAHGTPVAGIIGAQGNNNKGITGMMWDTKLINYGPAEYDMDIIEALNQVYQLRKLYNDTDGERGAFIVAVNCSWGFGGVFPDDLPGFCNVFKILQEEGVLAVCAAANLVYDFTEEGDLPSACPAENIISVTSIDINETLFGAYSKKYVDLAAPGEKVYSTTVGNEYREVSGASFSTAHISGIIGVLYSQPCKELTINATSEPQITAMNIKDYLFNSTRELDAVKGKVSTDGIVDLRMASQGIYLRCDGDLSDLTINNIYPNPGLLNTTITVDVDFPDFNNYEVEIFDIQGRKVLSKIFNPVLDPFVDNSIFLDLTTFQSGVYILRFSNDRASDTMKFIVQ